MNDATPDLSAEMLLGHERFVRSIARGVLHDENDVQDAVQDTWLHALQRGPRAIGALPRWLGRVARSRSLDRRRAEVRRLRREGVAAAASTADAVDGAFQRLATQHDVVAAVLALREPYRSVVLLRYYHDLEPIEIAARLQTKASTVRTQLVRAHELLRERLDRDHGRKAWAAFALPSPSREPVLAVSAAVVIGAATALAALYVLAATRSGESPLSATSRAADSVVTNAAAMESDPDTVVGSSQRELADVVSPQERSAKPIPEVIGPRAVLFDQSTHHDYEHSAFSFEHGYGGKQRAKKRKARGDWDLLLFRNVLRVVNQNDDRSTIVDLGPRPLVELTRAPMAELETRVRDAVARWPITTRNSVDPNLTIERGRSYFVWTNDTDSDLATLFEVSELVANDTCTLEWYSTEDGSWARGSLHSPRGDRTLAELALALRETARPDTTLREPKGTLQVRSGAVGGNPCRIDLAGTTSIYIREESETPLVLDAPPGLHDQPTSFWRGGTVPRDMKFVITRTTWWGEARGDGNGRARLHVQIGEHELVNVEKTEGVVRGEWAGRVEIAPGDEERVFLEISNSSYGELVVEGTFEPLQGK